MNARKIIKKVARMHKVSEEEVREQLLFAMRVAASDPNPAVRARWAAIPKKGETPTVEEFIQYLGKQVSAAKPA